MPYRLTIPEGDNALFHMLHGVGTEALINARKQLIQIVYSNHDTPLTHREREGMRILCTAIIGCPICNSLRLWRDHDDFCEEQIPEDFYQNALAKNYPWAGFNDRERLVVEFSDRFCNKLNELNGDDAFWERMHASFNDREIADIGFYNSYFLGVGAMLKAFGIGSTCEITPATDSAEVSKLINRTHGDKTRTVS